MRFENAVNVSITPVQLKPLRYKKDGMETKEIILTDRGQVVKADIPCSFGSGRRGFDPRHLRRTKRAFFPPLAI
jgi:hypothetical protein